MKKLFLIILLAVTLESCGTLLGGKVTDCQRTKPTPGTPSRKIRPAALIGSAAFGLLPLAIDFATGAIYKPCKTK